jgi:N-acetylglucosamine kinase-like BadF-type ATPase
MPMKIIAESGSTKTDWVVLNQEKTLLSTSTAGFNPTYYPAATLDSGIKEITPTLLASKVKEIYFYGAGCASAAAKDMVYNIFKNHFKNASIEVQHDLFGAARALFGNGKGLASILGTGSSSCIYENNKIVTAIPSLGYLLADDGSGANIGSELIKAHFYGDFPDTLQRQFVADFDIDPGNFITKLYAREKPNAYIASFVPFAVEHKGHPFIAEIVKKAFRQFFRENTLKYKDFEKYDLGFSGSVAYLFKNYLEEVAGEFGLTISKVIKSPIDALKDFHVNH